MNNPIQMLKNMILNRQINNPIFKEVITKAQNGCEDDSPCPDE